VPEPGGRKSDVGHGERTAPGATPPKDPRVDPFANGEHVGRSSALQLDPFTRGELATTNTPRARHLLRRQ
jgi:hypothetical protein